MKIALPVLLLVLLAGAGACGSGEAEPPRQLEKSSAPAPRAGAGARERIPEVAPGSGEAGEPAAVRVELGPRGLSFAAEQVSRREILKALEQALGFKLVLRKLDEGVSLETPVSIALEDVPPGEALVRLLEGVPVQLLYGAAEAENGSRLLRVSVGMPRAARERPSREERRARRGERGARNAEAGTRRAQAEERRRERAELAAKQIESADPATRAEGARWLPLDGGGVERLGLTATEDPDAEVRAAAIERLADSDSAAAVNQLLWALRDDSPVVVIAALDALEWAGDETLVPQLRPLLQHPDPAVRERTAEAIEFLE